MGLQLPGALATLLNDLGYTWPMSDEDKLLNMGSGWLGFTSTMDQPVGDANAHATSIWTQHKGEGVQAFANTWNAKEAPHNNLLDGKTGGDIIGAGLMICSAIVIALKINVIVQLVQLAIEIAQAFATSAVTAGGSLMEIPVFKEITSRLVNLCVSLAMNAVLGG
ncbi:hypothetical protein GCM10023195_38650 [Actinoallomurus liliacearum]|uniref:Outer membrane channel protein CpnT-like N-terminal domain-containing protein n=1 Tax=Actinoallomurus liliacearum TaxID=1080073 RepID=A0ABP8TN89_9ACTN